MITGVPMAESGEAVVGPRPMWISWGMGKDSMGEVVHLMVLTLPKRKRLTWVKVVVLFVLLERCKLSLGGGNRLCSAGRPLGGDTSFLEMEGPNGGDILNLREQKCPVVWLWIWISQV